jgi:hypothetical protein
MNIAELAQVFADNQVPHELSLLLAFQQQYGSYTYAEGFSFSAK